MTLADDFQFSQGSLQDFVDCRRRFWLRYVERRRWPALETEPAMEAERFMQQGARFHRMVQQHMCGVSAERLGEMVHEEHLSRWWDNYRQYAAQVEGVLPATGETARRFVEVTLSAPLVGYSLLAKCDLIVVGAEKTRLVDWKTARRRPRRTWLAARLQTRVYPYLLARAGAHLNGGTPIEPEQIEMIYWFADHPQQPERFAYTRKQYRADEAFLTGLVKQIGGLPQADFQLTTDERQCQFCVYRSLCGRGVQAGQWDLAEAQAETGDDLEFDLEFDQIGEIAF